MISKELLSEVLCKEVDSLTYVPYIAKLYDEGYSYTLTDGMIGCFINIYELAHKCKEWAYGLGYNIKEEHVELTIYNPDNSILSNTYSRNGITPEHIFRDCELILI